MKTIRKITHGLFYILLTLCIPTFTDSIDITIFTTEKISTNLIILSENLSNITKNLSTPEKQIISKIKKGEAQIQFQHKYFNKEIAKQLNDSNYKSIYNNNQCSSKYVYYVTTPKKIIKNTTTPKTISKNDTTKIINYNEDNHWNHIKKIFNQTNIYTTGQNPRKATNKYLLYADKSIEDHTLKNYLNKKNNNLHKIVCIHDKKLVGFATYIKLKNNTIKIDLLAVDNAPENKHKGHGKKLLNYIATQAEKLGIKKIKLTTFVKNHVARLAYLKTGFEYKDSNIKECYERKI